MDEKIESEIDAIKAILKALEPLDDEVRTNVLEYVLKKLNMPIKGIFGVEPASQGKASLTEMQPLEANSTIKQGMHIKEFKELKSPKSGIEMAAIVAYYLQHIAQESERKNSVTASDMETWFQIADYPLPNIQYVLPNAKNAGYLDSAPGTGAYKLNAVGYNLVKHNLPRKGNEPKPRKTRRNGKKANKK